MSTRIVAIRHAKPLSEGYAEDALRPLSEEGKIKQLQLTQQLLELGIRPTRIFTSPLLRAQQTAQIATDVFGIPYENEDSLGDNFNAKALLEHLSAIEGNATLFLVGHAPTLGNLVNRLVGTEVLPSGLSKSSAAIVDFEDDIAFNRGTFVDYMKP